MIHHSLYEDDLQTLANRHRFRVKIFANKQDVHQQFAQDIANFIEARNKAGQSTALIMPVGPTKQYPLLAQICNERKISWKRVHTFQMDEYLDWQGRLIPETHPLSFTGYMKRFIALLDEELRIPEAQMHVPDPVRIDEFSEKIEEVGGIDCCYGGIGIHGHIAFNEPPVGLYHQVSVEAFKQSKTRIVPLNTETIVMNSSRVAGGRFADFPPMSVTIGMKDILASRRIRLYCDGGEWQKCAIRHAVAGEPGLDYPVSLLRGHPDYEICLDEETAAPIQIKI